MSSSRHNQWATWRVGDFASIFESSEKACTLSRGWGKHEFDGVEDVNRSARHLRSQLEHTSRREEILWSAIWTLRRRQLGTIAPCADMQPRHRTPHADQKGKVMARWHACDCERQRGTTPLSMTLEQGSRRERLLLGLCTSIASPCQARHEDYGIGGKASDYHGGRNGSSVRLVHFTTHHLIQSTTSRTASLTRLPRTTRSRPHRRNLLRTQIQPPLRHQAPPLRLLPARHPPRRRNPNSSLAAMAAEHTSRSAQHPGAASRTATAIQFKAVSSSSRPALEREEEFLG